jgi:hypothetical protein
MHSRIFTMLLLAAPLPALADCLRPGEPLTGRLALARGTHPTAGAFSAMQLRFDGAVCIETATGRITLRVLDLEPADNAAKHMLREAVGYRVTVRGQGLARASTPWHVAEGVLNAARLVRRER